MTWLAPWAFIGLLALAVPVVVHMLARRRTRVHRFPTLRFIAPTRVLPVRVLRPSDPLLLALRCAILAAVVAALAQPLVLTRTRLAGAARVPARVVIVDTSASMRRPTTEGGSALDAARRAAADAAGGAAVAIVVESAAPARELDGAAEWLRHQAGAREVVVISDFQAGSLDDADIARVPAGIGVDPIRVPVRADTGAVVTVGRQGGLETEARATAVDGSTEASWTVRRAGVEPAPLLLLAAPTERAAALATLAATRAFTSAAADTARAVAIVFPGHERRAELERTAAPPAAPWMGDVAAAAWGDGRIVRAARADVDGRERLLLFTDLEPGTLAAAELVVAVANALAPPMPATEVEPATIDEARLAAWRRPASSTGAPGSDGGASDGRWLWLLVLLLLGVETVVRRPRATTRAAPAEEARLDHVA